MFLAPCTLPLVPGFLAFIGGVSAHGADAHAEPARVLQARLLRNALFYVPASARSVPPEPDSPRLAAMASPDSTDLQRISGER